MNRLPLYFFSGSQPYTDLHRLALAAGISWAELCEIIEIPDDEATFFWWLREYLIEKAQP